MQTEKQGYVYILSNWKGSTLYVGVTNNLKLRIFEHKGKGGSELLRCTMWIHSYIAKSLKASSQRFTGKSNSKAAREETRLLSSVPSIQTGLIFTKTSEGCFVASLRAMTMG
jgi:predicted GIY-YIG superfamily endonuclease